MQISGGYDTIVGAYCAIYSAGLVAFLDETKQRCISEHLNVTEFLGGWVMGAGGKRTSSGKAFYAYHLRRESVDVFFSTNLDGFGGTFYNILYRFGAMPLMMHGVEWCFSIVHELFSELHVQVVFERLSEIHLATDIVDFSVDAWQSLAEDGAYITRAGMVDCNQVLRTHIQKGKQTGISVGKGTMLRIYDKVRELEHKSQDKLLPMIEWRWGGRKPETATRVEMQIRRDWLKSKEINTFADFQAQQSEILRYFYTKWFRITSEVPDKKNKHQSRIPSEKHWAEFTDAACELYSSVILPQRVEAEMEYPDNDFAHTMGMMHRLLSKDPKRYCECVKEISCVEDPDEQFRAMLQVMVSTCLLTPENAKENRKKFMKKFLERRSSLPMDFVPEDVFPWMLEKKDWESKVAHTSVSDGLKTFRDLEIAERFQALGKKMLEDESLLLISQEEVKTSDDLALTDIFRRLGQEMFDCYLPLPSAT